MSKFFDPKAPRVTPEKTEEQTRLFAPATERNRDVICEVLKEHLSGVNGTLVEIASGTGQHAVHIAPHLPEITWQPTDIEDAHIRSIDAWRAHSRHSNINTAQHFNIIDNDFSDIWGNTNICAVAAMNLIHIAPWQATENLLRKAGSTLSTGNILFLYGPYKRGGEHTSESNANFDQSLKSRDADWGIRDLEAVSECAANAAFTAPDIIEMPSNNLSLIFRKA